MYLPLSTLNRKISLLYIHLSASRPSTCAAPDRVTQLYSGGAAAAVMVSDSREMEGS